MDDALGLYNDYCSAHGLSVPGYTYLITQTTQPPSETTVGTTSSITDNISTIKYTIAPANNTKSSSDKLTKMEVVGIVMGIVIGLVTMGATVWTCARGGWRPRVQTTRVLNPCFPSWMV